MASVRHLLISIIICCRFSKGDMESWLLNGFDHALLDAYIYSASRPALPAASLSLRYIFSFMCLAILIYHYYLLYLNYPQDCLLDELDLLGKLLIQLKLATSSALGIASLNLIGHYKANCLSATPCCEPPTITTTTTTSCLEIIQSPLRHEVVVLEVHVPCVSMGLNVVVVLFICRRRALASI